MLMKKSYGYLATFIAFICFTAIAFALPIEPNNTFWILYLFTALAILSQIYVWNIAFSDANSLKSKFFGTPIANLGITYLVLQIIIFARCITIPNFPDWLALIICTALLGVIILCIIGTEVSRSEIIRVENKTKEKTIFIKSIQLEVELLIEKEPDAEIKKALEKLKETIRYSDPVSNEKLYDIESEINDKIKNISNSNDKLLTISEINSLITERNKKCTLYK